MLKKLPVFYWVFSSASVGSVFYFSTVSFAFLILSILSRRMHFIVIFCFISVDGSFQEEATEENNKKSEKTDHQFGVTWRYVRCH